MAGLHQKLSYIMEQNKITDTQIAAAVHSDRSTVNKWRHNKLVCRRDTYGPALCRALLAAADASWLCALLGVDAAHSDSARSTLAERLEAYLYDDTQDLYRAQGASGDIRILKDRAPAAGAGCFLDVEGLLDALYLLRRRMTGVREPPPLSVYLSSDNCKILLDEKLSFLWEDLYLLNQRRPVRMILEGCREDERFREILHHLMPSLQTGHLELYTIASDDRYFCYHMSFLCEDTCMVMATEPAAASGVCVSFYVEAPEFVRPMSRTLAGLRRAAKPMARAVTSSKMETLQLGGLMEPDGALRTLFGSANLLYASADGFRELLRRHGLSYAQRKHPLERFRDLKERFETFLAQGEYHEIVSLSAVDDILRTSRLTVFDLSVPLAGSVSIDPAFLRELLDGMIRYTQRFSGLHLLLVRDMQGPFHNITCRIREERSLLLHTWLGDEKHCIRSEHWLFVGEYNRLLREAAQSGEAIRAPDRVRTVLTGRLRQTDEAIAQAKERVN